MARYRVGFQRTTSVELYLDVEADSEATARVAAQKATESSDDCLVELPETYSIDCGPTGEIEEIEQGEPDGATHE